MCNIMPGTSSNCGIAMENQLVPVVLKRSIVGTRDESNSKQKRRKINASFSCEDPMIIDNISCGELHEDLLARVLVRLPVSSLFSFRSVCKGWNSMIYSPSFLNACSEVPFRCPWFYMVDSKFDQGIVYDTEVNKWHHINLPSCLSKNVKCKPVASAGALICFESSLGNFIVCNPLTGQCCRLPHLKITQTIHAITMVASKNSYKVILIYGDWPTFVMKVYDSSKHYWSQPSISSNIKERRYGKCYLKQNIGSDDGTVYFLNKGGNVVASDVRRSPSKEYSSILTSGYGGEEIVYFLNRGGKVVACNTHKGLWYEYPPLLPSPLEYSLDIVNCGGRMFVVVLLEFLESAHVRIWEFNETQSEWVQVLAMPPSMSQQYYGKKADINCIGYDNLIMICVSSGQFNSQVLCNILENSWLELPPCYLPGSQKVEKFVSAFPFEPKLEASV